MMNFDPQPAQDLSSPFVDKPVSHIVETISLTVYDVYIHNIVLNHINYI